MFGIRYAKASPTTYLIQYRNGQPVREGAGLAFFYFAPSASLVSIPMESVDAPFMFTEVSADFQQVTVQGQVTYRVSDPKLLASLMNFTLQANGVDYVSEDPTKLPQRVVNAVQVQLRAALQGQKLQDLLRESEGLVQSVREGLRRPDGLLSLGLELVSLAILAIKPTPDTARALEATIREQILKDADDALYLRRNAAIEQERAIKENELNTEIAVETKKRQIRETQMDAERAVLEKRLQIDKRDFVYDEAADEYECPAGERAIHRFATEENGLTLHKYWSSACPRCPMRTRCTTASYRRITRWEHEHVLERMQMLLDARPQAAVVRKQTVEHVFGTLKSWLGTTPLLTKTLPKVRTEISLAVLAYNMKRMIKIMGTEGMVRGIAA